MWRVGREQTIEVRDPRTNKRGTVRADRSATLPIDRNSRSVDL